MNLNQFGHMDRLTGYNQNQNDMKRVVYLLIAIILSAATVAQNTDSSRVMTKQDYLQKSKSQKTAAWILLGGGVALDIGGGFWAASDFSINGPDVLIVVGTASILASIPFFIASGKNKRKAMKATVFFKMEKGALLSHSLSYPPFPALHIQINL
jgi:hypothetical protein